MNLSFGRFLPCLTIAFLFLLCACAKSTPSEMLAHADEAISRGEAADAIEVCQRLEDETLTPSQLCHCALIYAKAAQIESEPEHMALAATALKKACEQNVDSVLNYFSKLPFTDSAILSEVYGICTVDNSSFSVEDSEYDEDAEAEAQEDLIFEGHIKQAMRDAPAGDERR